MVTEDEERRVSHEPIHSPSLANSGFYVRTCNAEPHPVQQDCPAESVRLTLGQGVWVLG